jgi:hypothetical protein
MLGFSPASYAVSEMMSQRWQVCLQITGNFLCLRGDGKKGLSGPHGTASEHIQYHPLLLTQRETFPEWGETFIGLVVEMEVVARIIHANQQMAHNVCLLSGHFLHLSSVEIRDKHDMVELAEMNEIRRERSYGFRHGPENTGVGLFITLVVRLAETRIIDENLSGII